MERPDLRIFFDDRLRHQSIDNIAQNYGLENEPNPDVHFELAWANRSMSIAPRIKTLQPVNSAALQQLAKELFTLVGTNSPWPPLLRATQQSPPIKLSVNL